DSLGGVAGVGSQFGRYVDPESFRDFAIEWKNLADGSAQYQLTPNTLCPEVYYKTASGTPAPTLLSPGDLECHHHEPAGLIAKTFPVGIDVTVTVTLKPQPPSPARSGFSAKLVYEYFYAHNTSEEFWQRIIFDYTCQPAD